MKIAEFEKISEKQFIKDWASFYGSNIDSTIEVYENMACPQRKTRYSAGHDFHIPDDVYIMPGEQLIIPTGIKCNMDNRYVMLIFPRSSLGIKKNMVISNTVPVIDADYYDNPDNEGHIFISVKNCGDETIKLKQGDAFAQAIFVEYGVADNGDITEERAGGIGSTGR